MLGSSSLDHIHGKHLVSTKTAKVDPRAASPALAQDECAALRARRLSLWGASTVVPSPSVQPTHQGGDTVILCQCPSPRHGYAIPCLTTCRMSQRAVLLLVPQAVRGEMRGVPGGHRAQRAGDARPEERLPPALLLLLRL